MALSFFAGMDPPLRPIMEGADRFEPHDPLEAVEEPRRTMREFGTPGLVVLFGSGETSPAGGPVYETLVRRMGRSNAPRIAILETPAGFEPNSSRVAGRIADFLRRRLAPFSPLVEVVPARKRGTPFSPDDPALLEGVLRTDMVFLGPGSPTYAVRQLRGSRAWHAVTARHLLGGTTVLASAAMIASGALSLPVYEIFKVGEDPRWEEGLDLMGRHGLSLVFIPHWNNADGGKELDTSRCYVGRDRFNALRRLLDGNRTIVGLDESTALLIDPSEGRGEVLGTGSVTVIRAGRESAYTAPQTFPLSELGPFRAASGRCDVPADVWEAAVAALASFEPVSPHVPEVPGEVHRLIGEREEARARGDWAAADILRQRILASGWSVNDTLEGPVLEPGVRNPSPPRKVPGNPDR
jgi:cyanophycinase-like exopeptidase